MSVLFALALAEVLARLLNLAPDIKPIDMDALDTAYRRSDNPILGYELKAGYTNANADSAVTFSRINSHGQRDVEHVREKPAGTLRVAVIGDSVVEGYGIRELDALIARQLEPMLADHDAEVLNFGVSGYNFRAYVELLKTRAIPFEPDVAVLIFVENDFDNYVHVAVPLSVSRPAWAEWAFVHSSLFRRVSLSVDWFGFKRQHDPLAWNQDAMGAHSVNDALRILQEIGEQESLDILVGIWPRFDRSAVQDRHWVDDGSQILLAESLCWEYGIPTFRFSDYFRRDRKTHFPSRSPLPVYTIGDAMHPNSRGCRVAAEALATEIAGRLNGELGGFVKQTHIRNDSAHREAMDVGKRRTPSVASVQYFQGRRLLGAGLYAEAARMFERALAQDPSLDDARAKGADAYHELACRAMDAGDPEAAIPSLDRALELYPDHFIALHTLARVQRRTGDRAGAIRSYQRSLELQPTRRDAWRELGEVYREEGDAKRATEALGRAGDPSPNRPAAWAKPVEVDGVPNLHQVSTNLYRSAQPTAQGMQNLQQAGIETVVNLRSFHSDRDEIGTTGLGYEHIYMKAWHPERKEVVRFLQIVTNPKRTPVLVHCQHGADRTGAMCALYRVVVQGWTKEAAIREMTEGGFGFHEVWANLPRWIADLDMASIKREAGMETAEHRE